MGSGVVGFLRAKNIPITTKLLMEIQNNEKEAVKRIAQKYGVSENEIINFTEQPNYSEGDNGINQDGFVHSASGAGGSENAQSSQNTGKATREEAEGARDNAKSNRKQADSAREQAAEAQQKNEQTQKVEEFTEVMEVKAVCLVPWWRSGGVFGASRAPRQRRRLALGMQGVSLQLL